MNNISINGTVYNKHTVELLYTQLPVNEQTKEIISFLTLWFNEFESSIAVNTSGSTGEPKTIHLPKKMMLLSAAKTNKFFDIKHSSNLILALPVKFIGGKMMLVRAILSGANVVALEPKANPLHNVALPPVHFAAFTPYQLQTMAKAENTWEKTGQIRNILLGGSAITPQLEAQIPSCKSNVFIGYGMTETASHIALKNLSTKQEWFTLLPDVGIKINNRNCLTINGDITNFSDLETSDIAVINANNEKEFKIKGRVGEFINSGGIKINPSEVELWIWQALQKLEISGVSNLFVTKKTDKTLGEKAVLYLESTQDLSPEQWKEIKACLPKYYFPREIFCIASFEYTATSKIDKIKTASRLK